MKKSNRTTPRVFSLMWMMSHHKSLVNVLFTDDVQSWVSVLFMESVQNPKSHSFYGKCPILVMAPKLQEDWFGTITNYDS